MIDISELPVIDNHSHLFNVTFKEHNLAKILSLSLNDMPEEQLTNTLMYKKALKEIAKFLKCDGTEKEVLGKRQAVMKAGYNKYVNNLFKDANIHTLLIDTGYKPADVSLEEFEKIVPCKVKYMFRIETVLDKLLKEKVDFHTAEKRFLQVLEEALNNHDVVALKSIIGYRTGLELKEHDRKVFENDNYSQKEFREYFLLRALEKAIEYDIPFQIHAAFGESNINVIKNNPLLLKEILESKKYASAKIVLVHGGYPYTFEASYLAAMYPNVYLDMSEMIPFVPLGSRKGLRDMFDMCPLNKIMYGSDGFVIPELHYLGAKIAKYEISALLNKLIEERILVEEFAIETAKNIFFNTAQKIYKL